MRAFLTTTLLYLTLFSGLAAQTSDHSVARQWNEEFLHSIRRDFARPVVHARNLYHASAAMYDTWALITGRGTPALMGDLRLGFDLRIDAATIFGYPDERAALEEAISYAAYRVLVARYANAPGAASILPRAAALMDSLGYDPEFTGEDFTSPRPAALGNFVAGRILGYGLRDGSNELRDYANNNYPDPVNDPLFLDRPFSILTLRDPNHWQPLAFPGVVIDQSGNVIGNVPGFLGASWGRVEPFALPEASRTDPTPANPIYGSSPVYHDPGPPPTYNPADTTELDLYRWNFELVLKWSSHLDPADSVLWDISPASRGNLQLPFPTDFAAHRDFYRTEGGQPGDGHAINPVTGQPYTPQIVPRGDYTRVLAEFWADGPESETPPGHWFVILNTVMDHPEFHRRYRGRGEELDPLEYDLKAYLTLGGAMHDAAITAWSIKGAYDYVRPITAIRFLASKGQATVPENRYYDPGGIRLDSGYIELVSRASEVVNSTALMTVKARAWIGNTFIDSAAVDQAGVDWINPSVWEPYQRPNFVTPNFAGYVSGHSTFSSAAATVLEDLTGSPYFPGGLGEFVAKENEFLVFEEGPSQDVVLQWATYRDASNETSLSRIWGGIHPPADDIPGRIIGIDVGRDATLKARELFGLDPSAVRTPTTVRQLRAYPNPVRRGGRVFLDLTADYVRNVPLQLYDAAGRRLRTVGVRERRAEFSTADLPAGLYHLRSADSRFTARVLVL